LIKTPDAQFDLVGIWNYIAADNFGAADEWIDKLEQKMILLSEQPLSGHQRDDLANGLRSFPVGDYIIFYFPLSNGIDVIRVLHGAMDIKPERFF